MFAGELFGHGLWWLLPLLMIVFCLVMMRGCRRSRGDPGGDEALEILRKRYARGEIDEREYQEKKRSLS